MKQNILFLLSLCIVLFSCSDKDDPIKEVEKPPVETKDPFITLKKTNIDFTNEGGSEAILIESNVTWTTKSSAGWCTVTPSSGNKSTESITIAATENKEYDNRSCTVTLESGAITKTITVNQGENLGLLITQDRYELGNEESTIKVEVKANVEFEVEINDEWITRVEARALTTSQIEFKIAKNDTYGNRDGSITIKQKGGGMTSTITIFQSQEDAIILSEKEFELTSEAQSVEVEIKTNIDYEIIIPEDAKDWVTHSKTRALRTETVVLDIAQNKDYNERTAKIVVKDKKTNLQETVTIKQAANTGLIVSDDKYEVSNDGGIIEVEVKANVEFDIEIADKWITRVETRGLTKTKLQFQVAKNGNYDSREGSITIKQKGGNLSSTIKVYQSQKDAIIISEKTFDLTSKKQAIQVELKTNVEFEVIIPEAAKSWVSYTPTRGLRTETLTLNISENKDYTARSTEVYVKNKKTSLQDTVTINQASNLGFTVSNEKFDLNNEATTIEVDVEANFDFDVKISDSWITQVETRGLTSTKLIFSIAKNSSYDSREGTITIKQKNGELSSTIKVYQSQKDAIIISEKTFDLSREKQAIEVELKTNVEFELIIPEAAKSWVSYTPTRGLRTETLLLNINENKGSGSRSTEIHIKDKETDLQETLTVNQIGKEPGVYYVEKMGTLGSMLSKNQKDTITTMIVRGEMNKADFEVMKKNIPQLRYIDLRDVNCEDNQIPNYALSDKNNIITILLPTSITAIGDNAFANCKSLSGFLDLPKDLRTIGKEAFLNCSSLTGSLILPDELTSIGTNAFANCVGFAGSLKLPAEITAIEKSVFAGCSGFKGPLILPEGLISIEDFAFQDCSGFTGKLRFPKSLRFVSGFNGCIGFSGVLSFPEELEAIGNSAFEGCTSFIGSLVFPDKLITIGNSSFKGCVNLDGSINFPEKLEIIEGSAFENCIGFEGSLAFSEGLKTIENRAFANCTSLTGSLNFPERLKKIASEAFHGCIGLTGSLNLPNELTMIGEGAFSGCRGISGLLNLPEALTVVEKNTFQNCSSITEVDFSEKTTEIKENAFRYCSGITRLKFGNDLITIGENAFAYCSNISGRVVFPISLTSMKGGTFKSCDKIDIFRFPHVRPLDYYANVLPNNATVEVPVSSVSIYKSTEGWKNNIILGYIPLDGDLPIFE